MGLKLWHGFLTAACALALPVVGGRAGATVTLPIEVMGENTPVAKTIQVDVPEGKAGSVTGLWLMAHSLSYPDKASVQVNGGPIIPLSNSTVRIEGPAKNFGGIGGAFAVLKLVVPLGRGVVKSGSNTISFIYNRTDGVSAGYRIVRLNFVTDSGERVLPQSAFQEDDPAQWRAKVTDAASLAEGKRLWESGQLINSPIDKRPIKAACADCHAREGRDLAYFAYSSHSIEVRAKFHGMNDKQAEEISSYVRMNGVKPVGRPWNPPYQPGPGLDAKPASAWAAGAGIDWALDRDDETFKYLFPNGIQKAAVATTSRLNVREIPIAMQLPDWNHWLPRIHPKEAWSDAWASSELESRYEELRKRYADKEHLAAYLASPQAQTELSTWQLRRNQFSVPRSRSKDIVWSPRYADQVQGIGLWQLVRMWEMVQEFDLAEHGRDYFGERAEKRTWFDHIPFMISPFMLAIRNDENGIGGSPLTNEYFSNAWYHVQLILNPGNGKAFGTTPVDWGYVWGKFKDMYKLNGLPEMGRFALYFAKGMQEWDNENGLDPQRGWNPIKVSISWMVAPAIRKMWTGYPQKTAVMEALLGAWLDKTMQFSPAEFYAKAKTSADFVPVDTNGYNRTIGDRFWYMIPAFRSEGVSEALLSKASTWAQTVWPRVNWTQARATPRN